MTVLKKTRINQNFFRHKSAEVVRQKSGCIHRILFLWKRKSFFLCFHFRKRFWNCRVRNLNNSDLFWKQCILNIILISFIISFNRCCKSMFSNRISYWLNVKGPSMSIDQACCSSLAALEQAVQAISRGECEAAIVGGCNVLLHPQSSFHYSRYENG